MLAYRHLFHAGGYADVFKHCLLQGLLVSLAKKDKPFFYLDTHAGVGRYDLSHAWAQKNREYEHGIGQLWERADLPPPLRFYVEQVRVENPDKRLRYYPGSPLFARRLLRPDDRMALTELNKEDCASLTTLFARDHNVHVRCMDGYQALKAFLPPPERRGLVLIDSSFDRAKEFARIVEALTVAYKRWATGMFAIWYPLMETNAMIAFERQIIATGIRKILKLEFAIEADDWTLTMRGCGMLVINPPWRFDKEAGALLDWLWPVLSSKGKGSGSVNWLVRE